MKPCKACGGLNKYANGVCKDCHTKAKNKYYQACKEKDPEYLKKHHLKYGKKQRDYYLRKTYGITSEEYNVLFDKQKGRCAICDRPQSELKHSLAVDHNHTTGELRGLLCSSCNTAIGSLRESTELFASALIYLNKW